MHDRQLAQCLLIDQRNEIDLAKFAAQRAQSTQVNQFAALMQKDHEKIVQKLEAFAGQRPDAAGARENRERSADDAPAARLPRRRDDRAVRAGAVRPLTPSQETGGVDFVAIKQEIAERCLAATQRELEAKPKEKFDRCYMGHQVLTHMFTVEALTVLKKHASPELAQVISQSAELSQNHLEQAKQILERLEGNAAPPTTARSGISPDPK